MKYPISIAVVAALVAASCSGGADDAMDYAREMAAMDPAEMAATMNKPVQLTEKTMKNFVAAMKEIGELSDKAWSRMSNSEIGNVAAGISASNEAMKILRKHGFKNILEFQRVTASIAGAMAAAEMEGREVEMEAQRQKLEGMKSQMTEAQYNAMMQSQGAMTDMVTDLPKGNVELVKKWRERLDAIGDNQGTLNGSYYETRP